MNELTEILKDATAGIDTNYFLLTSDTGPTGYRRRVYCYELYHQLRMRWPDSSPFRLNGKIARWLHPFLTPLDSNLRPDFLVHQPKNQTAGHVVIEVKSSSSDDIAIKNDLQTFALFGERLGFKRAIYLVYGSDNDSMRRKTREVASIIELATPVELWVHEVVGQAASQIEILMGDTMSPPT